MALNLTAAYCKARAKIPLDLLEKINAHLVDRIQGHIPNQALWHGRHIKLGNVPVNAPPHRRSKSLISCRKPSQCVLCAIRLPSADFAPSK